MSQGATVITAANAKGGCGKSTTILILAGEYAAAGQRVHVIDADPQQRLLRWAAPGTKPGSISVTYADHTSISQQIDDASETADVVLIDLEGSANLSVALAVASSHLVLIPAQISHPDVEDALQTVQMIDAMAKRLRRPIAHGLVWSCAPPAIRSREMQTLEAHVASQRIPILSRVFHRAAFTAMYSFATTLDHLPASEVPGIDKAKADAGRLSAAVTDALASAEVAA